MERETSSEVRKTMIIQCNTHTSTDSYLGTINDRVTRFKVKSYITLNRFLLYKQARSPGGRYSYIIHMVIFSLSLDMYVCVCVNIYIYTTISPM